MDRADERIWHYGDPRRCGSKKLTGRVALVSGRFGKAHRDWLHERDEKSRQRAEIATFH